MSVTAEAGVRAGLQARAEQQQFDPDEVIYESLKAVHDSGDVTGPGGEVDFRALLRQGTELGGGQGVAPRDTG